MECCPNLVYGTGDETRNILSVPENLREGVTEGWCGLDGREADFSLRDKKKNIFKKKTKKTPQHFSLNYLNLFLCSYQCSRCLRSQRCLWPGWMWHASGPWRHFCKTPERPCEKEIQMIIKQNTLNPKRILYTGRCFVSDFKEFKTIRTA